MWLEYPVVGGPSPDISIKTKPENAKWFCYHSSRVTGRPPRWVTASGAKDLREIKITLANETPAPHPYTVRLYFAEPEPIEKSNRVFDIAIQGKPLLENFDIIAEAGAPNRGIVKQFTGIKVADDLTVALTPSDDAGVAEPILCGLEVIAEKN